MKDSTRPQRRSIRLKGYDYSQAGLYFITLCCQKRFSLFCAIRQGRMILNSFGKIIEEEWTNKAHIRDNVALYDFVIMPNHFHAILEILFSQKIAQKSLSAFESPVQTIGAIIRGFKGASTRKIRAFIIRDPNSAKGLADFDFSKSIWYRNYYERIIRDEQAYQNIANYIKNNPSNWQKDKFNNK